MKWNSESPSILLRLLNTELGTCKSREIASRLNDYKNCFDKKKAERSLHRQEDSDKIRVHDVAGGKGNLRTF